MSFDVWLENRTPFEAATHVQMDKDGQEVLLAVLSASFQAPDWSSHLEVAPAQLPVQYADVPSGDPTLSSNLHEADIALRKPIPEILVLGSAHAPRNRPAPEVEVRLDTSDIHKCLRVIGDRVHVAGGLSPPRPFQTMPIRWERAFGGTAPDGHCDQRNPVGIGYRGARSADPAVLSTAPNIAYAEDRAERPAPAGFTALGRGWLPRLPLAGTYDGVWLAEQWPLPPHDFDDRYNLCGPADQRSERLRPGETVRLTNLTPNGLWEFRIPDLTLPIHLVYADRIETRRPEPDTILVEPDLARVTLKARLATRIERNSPHLKEIVLGHVSPVWLSARRKGKAYLNPRGGDGTLTDRPLWAA